MSAERVSKSIPFAAVKATQPIGEFYVGVIDSKTLCEITYVDIRRIEGEREVETYLGIQRPLDEKRAEQLAQYVNTVDACFPTAVILAVDGVCAGYDAAKREMTLSDYTQPDEGRDPIAFGAIAKVLDGQHRIEGLRSFKGPQFDVNVCIFVDMDIAEQAYIFATVNLAQTKVNKSLVYDLFDLAKAPSPQKLCHNVAVALDRDAKSPLHERIKRLGVATPGRYSEKITQATFVESLIKYISLTEMQDRDLYKRGKTPAKADAEKSKALIFRNMMIEGKDTEIATILWNYFAAVRDKWPEAWNEQGRGAMLNKTNGFRGLMRFLHDAYLWVADPGGVPKKSDFDRVFNRISLRDSDFSTDNFAPGTSGESKLYRELRDGADLKGE